MYTNHIMYIVKYYKIINIVKIGLRALKTLIKYIKWKNEKNLHECDKKIYMNGNKT